MSLMMSQLRWGLRTMVPASAGQIAALLAYWLCGSDLEDAFPCGSLVGAMWGAGIVTAPLWYRDPPTSWPRWHGDADFYRRLDSWMPILGPPQAVAIAALGGGLLTHIYMAFVPAETGMGPPGVGMLGLGSGAAVISCCVALRMTRDLRAAAAA